MWVGIKIEFYKKSKLSDCISNDEYFYFIHSFNFVPKNKKDIVATTKYGGTLFQS